MSKFKFPSHQEFLSMTAEQQTECNLLAVSENARLAARLLTAFAGDPQDVNGQVRVPPQVLQNAAYSLRRLRAELRNRDALLDIFRREPQRNASTKPAKCEAAWKIPEAGRG